MSNKLDALVATRVMQWKAGQPNINAGLWVDQAGTEHGINHGSGRWSPSTSIADAMEGVEKMSERGWWARIDSPFTKNEGEFYTCGFTPMGTTGWNGRPDHYSQGKTAPLAICIAALRAIGVPDIEIEEVS